VGAIVRRRADFDEENTDEDKLTVRCSCTPHHYLPVGLYRTLAQTVINSQFTRLKVTHSKQTFTYQVNVNVKCYSRFTCNVSFLNLMHGWYSLVVTQPSTSHQLVCMKYINVNTFNVYFAGSRTESPI